MSVLQKLMVTMIGQNFSYDSALSTALERSRNLLMTTVITGILIASSVLAIIYGVHHLMILEGASESAAYLTATGILLFSTLISAILARHYFLALSGKKDEILPLSPEDKESPKDLATEVGETVETIVTSFLNGFMEEGRKPSSAKKKPKIELVKDTRK